MDALLIDCYIAAASASQPAARAAASNAWSWAPLLQWMATLISVGIGAWLSAWFIDRRENRARLQAREADFSYLAVTVSAVLHAFVSECASAANDDGLSRGQLDYTRHPEGERTKQVPDPRLSYAGLDVAWKAMPIDLLDRLHALPARLEQVRKYLAEGVDQDGGGDDYFARRRLNYAELGVDAGKLLTDLRIKAGLSASFGTGYNALSDLDETLAELRKKDESYWAQQNQTMAVLGTQVTESTAEKKG
jgi:hypothetical protein